MDLNSTIDIIIKDLRDVHDIIDDLKSIPGVPALQVELAKAKCKTASDVIALLKNLPQTKVVVKEQVGPKKAAEPAIKSGFTGEKTPSKQTATPEISNPVTHTEVSSKKSYEQPIIADQFANRSESFNEKLGSLKHEDDVLEILKSKPVTSLAEAIGVNDKFLFIREIFKGNQEIYNQAINKLESVANVDEAISIIRDYAGESTENEAVRQLLDLIKRKLPANE